MRIIRVTAALAALVAGSAHLSLYFDGYRDIPVGHIGTQFILNALGAVVVAGALVAPLIVRGRPRWSTGRGRWPDWAGAPCPSWRSSSPAPARDGSATPISLG